MDGNIKVRTIIDVMDEWGCETIEDFVLLEEAMELADELAYLRRLKDIAKNYEKKEDKDNEE